MYTDISSLAIYYFESDERDSSIEPPTMSAHTYVPFATPTFGDMNMNALLKDIATSDINVYETNDEVYDDDTYDECQSFYSN